MRVWVGNFNGSWGGMAMYWVWFYLCDRCSPVDSLLGLAVSRLVENLHAAWGLLAVSTAWPRASAVTGSTCAAATMSVGELETEPDTDFMTGSFAWSGAQDMLPLLAPLFLLSTGTGSARPMPAAPAPSLASVSAWAFLLRFCIVSGRDWTVSCVPVQRGLCSVSRPTLPPGPISGNTPWGMPPPTGVSREKQKRVYIKQTKKQTKKGKRSIHKSQLVLQQSHNIDNAKTRGRHGHKKAIFIISAYIELSNVFIWLGGKNEDKMTNEWHLCVRLLSLIWDHENMQACEVEQPVSVGVQALRQPFMKSQFTSVTTPMDFITSYFPSKVCYVWSLMRQCNWF